MRFRIFSVLHFRPHLAALDFREIGNGVSGRDVAVRGRALPAGARFESPLVDDRPQGELLEDGFRFRKFWQLLARSGGDDERAEPGLRHPEVASLQHTKSDLKLGKIFIDQNSNCTRFSGQTSMLHYPAKVFI